MKIFVFFMMPVIVGLLLEVYSASRQPLVDPPLNRKRNEEE